MAAALLAVAPLGAPVAQPQVAGVPSEQDGEEVLAVLRTNGVHRGEFTLLRRPNGDFWIAAEDMPALRLEPRAEAQRALAGRTWYSARSLGAQRVDFDEREVTLSIDFSPESLKGMTVDLSRSKQSRSKQPLRPQPPPMSLILSYRLTLHGSFDGAPARARLDHDLNVRVGPVLLRQEARIDSSVPRRFVRGPTQAIWDDARHARRWTVGDVLSSAGNYGTTITGAGLLVQKLYDLAPDVLKHPTATVQATATMPSDVEVTVDGNPVYRTRVGPGPVSISNLALNGGTQTVRVTVTDASGRRQVFEQPFHFTDAALAQGLHEYSYFVGRRSELGSSGEFAYREAAWQAQHRYGLTNQLTIAAGGEGAADFTNAGAGFTLRSDRLGLFSLDLLASRDRPAGRQASGWSARYQYLTPGASFILARRHFGDGFRSFAGQLPFVQDEARIGAARSFGPLAVSADLVRSVRTGERRISGALRLGYRLARSVMLGADVQRSHGGETPEWSANLFLRAELGGHQWLSTGVRTTESTRSFDIETGRPLPPGEGLGYRAGLSHAAGDEARSFAYGAAEWNLRHAAVDVYANAPLRGGRGYGQVSVGGALVALGSYWGVTRRVTDSFAVASLGVPQAGVEVLLNNQVQGTTDAQGRLFIPQVGAFGRQDVAINDTQLHLHYAVDGRLRTIMPAYRSGTLVDFGGRRLRAVAGTAWALVDGRRQPLPLRSWTLHGGGRAVPVQTASEGDFYLEDVVPGMYRGVVADDERTYACRLEIPAFEEPVLELKEGIVCE